MATTQDVTRARTTTSAWVGLGVALTLMAAGVLIPLLSGWDVHVRWFPPLHAEWDPRVGLGTIPALILGVAGATYASRVAESLSWRSLLWATYATGILWLVSLALVDGREGISAVLEHSYEYLETARTITDVPGMLEEYVSRIPYAAEPNNWPVHLAGHPPGAVLFFIVLVRIGLGGGLAAGLVVTFIAASTAPAVMTTLRTLGAETAARRAAPFLVFTPAAIWMCVSADAMFAAVAAWGMAALAVATVRRSLGWSIVAGLILGYVVMMSYGLPLLGVLALSILYVGGSWRPLAPAVVAACVVVGAFAVYGFTWWEALPALRERYWDGVASNRPPEYWMWGNLAALAFSAGPVAYAGLAHLWSLSGPSRRPLRDLLSNHERPEATTPELRVVTWLAGSGVVMVLLANVSQMSRAEVERIWLPFVPWLLISCALLPQRWRMWGLVGQIVTALVVQHLLWTDW